MNSLIGSEDLVYRYLSYMYGKLTYVCSFGVISNVHAIGKRFSFVDTKIGVVLSSAQGLYQCAG